MGWLTLMPLEGLLGSVVKSGFAIGVSLLFGSPVVAGCGGSAEACSLSSGEYHIALPEWSGAAAPGLNTGQGVPAVVMLHGYGGSGSGVLRNRSLVETVTGRGFALLAPEGLQRGRAKSWNFFPGWEGRDEVAFLQDVVADSAVQFGIDPDRVLLAGFSAGAFMVNYLACSTPEAFAAYAPVAGGFWRPQPDNCAGGVHLLHTHGWTDGVVPLEGRYLAAGRFQQGDIFAGLELWRQTNECETHAPDQRQQLPNGVFFRRWSCDKGKDLSLALFAGGHQIPRQWADMALDWFLDRLE